jgi:chorismate synthase
MAGNSFGTLFKLTTFGESHGSALGGVIEGCPANFEIDFDFIDNELARRRPGQSKIVTQRKESDRVFFLSGIFEGKTTGAPIAFIIPNENQKSQDYEHLKDVFRPSHADFTYQAKYGHRDYRGGGRSSARETVSRVVAGAIAKQILIKEKITIQAYVSQVGTIKLEKEYTELNLNATETNIVRCPDSEIANKMIALIENIRKKGDSVGGIITCVIKNVPFGLGEPVFDKLHAQLGKAMLSINAVKGFEIGSGFNSVNFTGSELNDEFIYDNKVKTKTNFSGGIQGGISNGEDIYFRIAFKPVATIMQTQQTITNKGTSVNLQAKGRHDPCVVPRAVPIVESMAALVLVDFLLLNKAVKI